MPVTIAITGGTGAYRTAHGELETSGPNEAGNEPLTLSSSSKQPSNKGGAPHPG